ncbi:MAG: SDR family oxidoreductase [Sphingomonadales bacterium]|nr:SDR family oxidoreductase [Sphingomonadales bacterium]
MSRRVALVTGAESGIGAACARTLARNGHDIGVLYYQDDALAEATLAAVVEAGGRGVTVRADVSQEHEVESAYDTVVAALGPPTVLVNSAGINQSGVTVAAMSFAQWKHMFGADLDGAFLTSRRFVRELAKVKAPSGRIVNISSIHAEDVRAGAADYCAAKGALRRLTETLSLEVARAGITVNAVAPGMILTPMNARAVSDADWRRKLEADIPIGRAGTAEEVAELVAFLASDKAAYITGATLTIDGGLSLLLALGA